MLTLARKNVCLRGLLCALLATTSLAAPALLPQEGPRISPVNPEVQFGTVWAGERLGEVFVVRNVGDEPLQISNIKPGCGCTIMSSYDKIIQPGEEGRIPFTFDSKGLGGSLRKTVTVSSNDPVQPIIQLRFQAEVLQAIKMNPAKFVKWRDGTNEVQTVSIVNQMEEAMRLEPIPSDMPSPFSYTIREIRPGFEYALDIDPTGPFPLGNTSVDLAFLTGLERQPQVDIRCRLFREKGIEVFPAEIVLGSPLPAPYSRTIELTYDGKEPFEVLGIQPSASNIKTRILKSEKPNYVPVEVTFPANFGLENGERAELLILTNLTYQEELLVPIVGFGVHSTPEETVLGSDAPLATLPRLGGGDVHYGPKEEGITAILFWSSWCRHSSDQVLAMERLARQYPGKLNLQHVSLDSYRPEEEILATALGWNAKNVGHDPEGVLAQAYGVTTVPTLVLLDRGGRTAAVEAGYWNGFEKAIQTRIDLLLKGLTNQGLPDNASGAARRRQSLAWKKAPDVPLGQPALVFESADQYTGTGPRQAPVSYRLHFKNLGNAPLEIEAATGSPGLHVELPKGEAIPPGGSGWLECSFVSPGSDGLYHHQATLRSNDPFRPEQRVRIWGMVETPSGEDG